ncbi:MAG: hypothetical protein ACHQNV_04770 [Vicinamibacteria bacterium]
MGRGGEAAFGAATLAASLVVFAPWLGLDARLEPRRSALNEYWKARVPDMIYGRAHRPFVERTLVPSAIRIIRRALPQGVVGAIRRTVSGWPLFLPRKLGVLGWEPAYLIEYAIALVVLFVILAAFPFALRRLFVALYDAPVGAFVAPLGATLLLPAFFFDRGTHYLYDFASLLLFTLALVSLATGRLGLYYLVFVLGILKKETMILAALVFLAVNRDCLPRPRLLVHCIAQLAIFGALRSALARIFAANPGGAVEWHLVKNLRLMARPDPWSLLMLASVGILVFARFGEKPPFLRRALVVLPPLVASYLFLGIYGEIRVFYEAYPILFLLGFENEASAFGGRVARRAPSPRLVATS